MALPKGGASENNWHAPVPKACVRSPLLEKASIRVIAASVLSQNLTLTKNEIDEQAHGLGINSTYRIMLLAKSYTNDIWQIVFNRHLVIHRCWGAPSIRTTLANKHTTPAKASVDSSLSGNTYPRCYFFEVPHY